MLKDNRHRQLSASNMKIAIASSGLGFIHRGMEAWAEDLAKGLFDRGVDISLFRGGGPKINKYDVILPTLNRNKFPAKMIAILTSKGGWRIGLGAPHAVESFIFGTKLIKHLNKRYNLVHVQQGSLALFLSRAQKLGLLKVPCIFANGQVVAEKFLSNFEYVQHLSPHQEGTFEATKHHIDQNSKHFFIPNLVNTKNYSPGDKRQAKKKIGVPENTFVIGTVGVISKHHKRMDYFIKEIGRLGGDVRKAYHVVMAGASADDTNEIIKLAQLKLGNRVSVFLDLPRHEMPNLYNAIDVFVLCSLVEALPMVVIEAMACGVPVFCHKYPSLEWEVQGGGECINMGINGNLAKILTDYFGNEKLRKTKGNSGRNRVFQEFSEDAVVTKTIAMYRSVISDSQK